MKFVAHILARTYQSKHARSSGIYLVSSAIVAAIPLILMPVLTRHLTPTDYGIMTMFGVFTGLISNLIGVNVHGAISKLVYEPGKTLPLYVTSALTIIAALFLVVIVLVQIFSHTISGWTEIPETWLWAASFCAFNQYVLLIIQTIWRFEIKPLPFALTSILSSLINVALSIWLVLSFDMNWQGRVIAQIITGTLFSVVSYVILARRGLLTCEFQMQPIQRILKFGVPLVPHTLASQSYVFIDRFFITHFFGLAETGTYSVAAQLSMALTLVVDSMSKSYTPWLFSQLSLNSEATNRRVVRLTYIAFGLMTVGAIVFAILLMWLLPILVGKDFVSAREFIPWVCLSQLLNAVYYIMSPYIFYAEKTHKISFITTLGVPINILASFGLVHVFGPIGVPMGACVSYGFILVLIWRMAAQTHPMPWLRFWKRSLNIP